MPHEAPGLAAWMLEIRLPGDGRRPYEAHSITRSISQMWTTVPCNQDMAGWRRATMCVCVCVCPTCPCFSQLTQFFFFFFVITE